MKRIFTTAILSFLVLFAFAQDTGTVKGTVKDKDSGETIIGASVVWEADKGRGAATDFDGNFSLTLPEGAQKVIITSIGYDSQTIAVTVKKGETSTVNVSMGVGSIQKEMVIVSAGKFEQKREDLTVSVSVIEPELLESRGSTSAEDALEQTPGLTIVDSEPQMRGGSGYSFGAGARVMMLVDDLPIMTGDAGRASFGFVPIENLEQIEVIKGASSVLYGSSALNGIINIRTAYPKDKPKTKINIYTGLYSAPQQESAIWWDKNDVPIYSGMNFFHSRKIKKTWDLVIGGNFLIDNGFIGPEPSDTLINSVGYVTNVNKDTDGNIVDTTYTQPRKGFENRFRMNFNLRKRSEKIPGLAFGINGNAMYSKSAGSLLWLNKDDGLFRPFGGSITLTKQTSYNIDPFITYSGPAGSKHTLRGRVFHQNNDNNNNQGNLNYVGFLEYQFAHKFANINDFTITIGAMGQYVYSKAQLYAGNGKGNGINTAINAAAYVQLDKKFWKRVNVNGGARFEYFAVNGNDTIIRPVFRIGANTKLWKEGYLRASFGEGFRFPTIAERYIFTVVGGLPIVPNTNIKPERSYAAEVALMQGIKIGKFMGYLDIAGFYQYYKNFVEFNGGNFGPVTGPFGRYAFRSLNTGDARVYGADVSLMGKGEFNSWFGMNVLLGYTYARPETMDPNYVYGTDSTGQQLTQLNTSSTIPNATVFDTPEQTAAREKAIADFIKYPVLKYRFEHLVNADVEFLFTIKKDQKLSVGLTYRYYSYMKSVDKVFYTLDALVGWGAVDFRNSHNKGDHVFDLRAAYDFTENIKLGVSVKNLTNRLYALRPLKVNPPRTIQLQLTVTF